MSNKLNAFAGPQGELLRRKLRNSYIDYCSFVNESFVATKFHTYLCDKIQEFLTVRTGKALDILLLSVPPRHGKSYTVTATLPTWYLGNNPRGEVIIVSYMSTFAEGFSKQCRDKFNKFAPEIFNNGPNLKTQRVDLWETQSGGVCRAAGIEAGLTGFGANLMIIDDPIKNQQEAESETIISKIHAEMGPSLQSRIYPNGKLIVIQTRWVEQDVIGYIQDHWSDFIWADINLPCEYDDATIPCPLGRSLGDSLMGPHLNDPPLPDEIANTNEWLKSKKQLVLAAEGSKTWSALYQGRPVDMAGAIFDTNRIQSFSRSEFATEKDRLTLPPHEFQKRKRFEYIQLSIDATFKDGDTNDFVGMGLRGIYQGSIYLYHQVNKRMGFVQTVEYVKKFMEDFPDLDEIVIEDKANGSAIADMLRYMPNTPPVVTVNPMGGKVARAEAISPFVGSGNYYIATDLPEEDVDWHIITNLTPREKIIQQFKSFPYGRHDDMVDEASQGMIRLVKLITGETPRQKQRFLRYNKWYPDMWEDYEQMNAGEQEKFIQRYGAPLEWRPEEVYYG